MTARTPQHPVGCTCLDGRYCAEQAFGPDDDGRTPDPWAELRRLAEAATTGGELRRYDHGGGRLAANWLGATPTLIADFYHEVDREFYAAALSGVSGLLAERDRLREVVEAARIYSPRYGHDWRCEIRTAAVGWKEGDPPVIRCECGLDELQAALDALDTGEARRE